MKICFHHDNFIGDDELAIKEMKMNKRIFWVLVSCALFFISAYVNAAELSQPQQLISKTSSEIKAVLKKDKDALKANPTHVYKLVDEILVPHVDLDRISSLILGKHWKEVSDENKKRFQNEFKNMLILTYATALNELDEWQMSFLHSTKSTRENEVMIRSKISQNGPPLNVDYRMRLNGDSWKVYDVTIEGISLVTNYRSSFKRLMQTSGIDGLISHMEKNNRKALSS